MTKPLVVRDDVRQRAEEVFQEHLPRAGSITEPLQIQEVSRIIQELEIHQIELEMQNEELRTAQVALETARTRYFDLYDLAPVGYCTLDASGLILEANLKAAHLLGCDSRALKSQPISRYIHSSDHTSLYFFQKSLMATGQCSSCELRMVDQGGKPFWCRMDATVPQWADGHQLYRLTINDITMVKLAEEQQSIAAATFETGTGRMVTDAKGVILKVNLAFTDITGYTEQDVLGKTPRLLKSGRHDDIFYKALWMEVERTGQWKGIIWNKRCDGEIYPQWLDIHAVKTRFGQVTHYVGEFNDISEQVKANEELQLIQKRMRLFALKQQEDFDLLRADLARDVHDELGQVLTALKLEIEMVSNEIPAAAQKMQQLVRQGVASVREISRTLRPVALELGLVPALRTMMMETSMRSDVDIHSNLSDSMPVMSQQVERVLYRIAQEAMNNAANHAYAKTIAVGLTFDNHQLELSIVDDGQGFDMFGPAFSSGLGLVGMQERADQIGARLDLQSSPGRGTTIVLTLPEPVLRNLQ
jgi:PAS domain S-box-containing protein